MKYSQPILQLFSGFCYKSIYTLKALYLEMFTDGQWIQVICLYVHIGIK